MKNTLYITCCVGDLLWWLAECEDDYNNEQRKGKTFLGFACGERAIINHNIR